MGDILSEIKATARGDAGPSQGTCLQMIYYDTSIKYLTCYSRQWR